MILLDCQVIYFYNCLWLMNIFFLMFYTIDILHEQKYILHEQKTYIWYESYTNWVWPSIVHKAQVFENFSVKTYFNI